MEIPLESYPTRAPVHWFVEEKENPDGLVVIVIEKNFNPLESIIARLFRAPDNLRRPLDKMNSALWELMDGTVTFSEIVSIMDSQFNESIAPARERCSSSISKMTDLNLVIIRTSPLSGDWDIMHSETSHHLD